MAIQIDGPRLTAIRCYLEEAMYAVIDLRLSFEVSAIPTGFPAFAALQAAVQRLDPAHQVLFRLFRLGEPVEETALRQSVPQRIFTALVATGLLVPAAENTWRTSGLLIVPVEGLALLAGIPASYPTASRPPDVWFDLSSYVVAKALPGSLAGRRVLDVCAGTGLQALLCAARGAARVVGLELNAEAVATARATAVLNGLGDKVNFRQSDLLSALEAEERFEYVVCNTPYAPVIEGLAAPAALDRIGNGVVWRLLEQLPRHLAEGGSGLVASWRAAGYRGSTYQMQAISARLEQAGCSTAAFVDPAPDTAEGVLRILGNDLGQRPGAQPSEVERIIGAVREMLQRTDPPVDGFYNQIIHFQQGTIESAPELLRVFGLIAAMPGRT